MDRNSEIKKSILKTVSHGELFYNLAGITETKEFLLIEPSLGRVQDIEFEKALEELMSQSLLFRKDNFLSLSHLDLTKKVSDRKSREMISRDKFKDAKEFFKGLARFKFIKYLGVIGNTSKGSSSVKDKVELIVIVTPGTGNLARFILNSRIRFFGKTNDYKLSRNINLVEKFPTTQNIKSAFDLLKMGTIINKDGTYEHLLQSNLWVFDHFVNYPFDKVGGNIRITSNSNTPAAGWFYRLLDKICGMVQ